MRFLGYCLNEKLKVLPEFRTAYMAISKSEYEKFDIQEGDTEGIVNMNLSIQGIRFGVFIVEKQGKIKMSFRSIGKFKANEFAAHFQGGGHHNAAGGQSEDDLYTTEQKFLSLLPQYQSALQSND